jgi:hypothetical protein
LEIDDNNILFALSVELVHNEKSFKDMLQPAFENICIPQWGEIIPERRAVVCSPVEGKEGGPVSAVAKT